MAGSPPYPYPGSTKPMGPDGLYTARPRGTSTGPNRRFSLSPTQVPSAAAWWTSAAAPASTH